MTQTEVKEREWTVMFYLASDNPLAPSTVSQLKAIKDAGFHPEVNVIAQFDPQTPNEPTHIFDVNYVDKLMAPGESNIGFSRQEPRSRSLVMDRLWNQSDIRESIGESLKKISDKIQSTNSGGFQYSATNSMDGIERPFAFKATKLDVDMDKETNPRHSLSRFLKFCSKNYPARHYMLFIMGHGLVVGNDLFLLDEHSGDIDQSRRGKGDDNNTAKHFLSLTDLGAVLRSFKKKIKKSNYSSEFELVGFHSCSMSGVEVAYELKNTAHYMLASQGPAFVGSWPYRQILMRVFNQLGPSGPGDLLVIPNSEKTVNEARTARDLGNSVARRQSANFLGNGGSQHASAVAVVDPYDDALRPDTAQPDLSRKSSNADAGSAEGPRSENAPSIKTMLTRIFYYCLYNSYDFQLAGYSYDLCLSDLTKVGELKEPIQKLATQLTKGLKDPSTQDRILLAHLKSQSYWQENYTDLYDFCLCLVDGFRRSDIPEDATSDLKRACVTVMDKLARGAVDHDSGIIVRSEFAGPAYQYSHGLSIFFPWTEPSDRGFWQDNEGEQKSTKTRRKRGMVGGRYQDYKFQKTGWSGFLAEYFKETMRKPHKTEVLSDLRERTASTTSIDISLLERISTLIYNADGQLAKGGPSDSTGRGKGGGNDPTGDCDCSSIKNYPHSTVALTAKGREPGEEQRLSPNFFDGFS